MPKQKTHKATKKRFRLTASGKAKHQGTATRHLLSRRSQKRKRKLRGTRVVNTLEVAKIQAALGNYSY
jgi:large subunit ribosomal protein L35